MQVDEGREHRRAVKRGRRWLEAAHLAQQVEEFAPAHGLHHDKGRGMRLEPRDELVVAHGQCLPLPCRLLAVVRGGGAVPAAVAAAVAAAAASAASSTAAASSPATTKSAPVGRPTPALALAAAVASGLRILSAYSTRRNAVPALDAPPLPAPCRAATAAH